MMRSERTFDAEPGTLGGDAREQRRSLLALATDFDVSLALLARAYQQLDRASVDLNFRQDRANDVQKANHDKREALIRAIIETAPRPWPDEDAWSFSAKPFWSARIGSHTYALVADRDHYPRDVDQAVQYLTVAVISTEGGDL